MAAVLLAVAGALKYLGTALPAARLLEVPGRYCGILFNYRLSFGIIAANVGLTTGVLDQTLYAVILLVVVTSAAIPMLALRDRPQEWTDTTRRERARRPRQLPTR